MSPTWDKEYPMGSFVEDAACPICGRIIQVNIPAKPLGEEDMVAQQQCRYCRNPFYIRRYKSGSYKITSERNY